MIDPTPNEKAAFVHGGEMGGEYLDSIGKTDLESLEPRGMAHLRRGGGHRLLRPPARAGRPRRGALAAPAIREVPF